MTPSSPYSTPQNNKKRTGCILLLLLGAGLVFLLVLGGYLYLLSQRPAKIPIVINISSPANGSVLVTGSPVNLTALAGHPDGIQRLEVYDNGRLVWVEEADSTAPGTTLAAVHSWAPSVPGRHLLTARATTTRNLSAESAIVFVDVVSGPVSDLQVDKIPRPANAPLPSLKDLSGVTGISTGQLAHDNPGLAGYDPGAPLPPGTSLHLPSPTPPPGDPGVIAPPPTGASGPAPAPVSGAPAIPTWNMVDGYLCTSIRLGWVDNPDETSYVLYRRAPGESSFNRLVSLPANTTRYTDSISRMGTYYYAIAAVRGGLETRSVIEGVALADSCAARFPAPPAVDISLSILALNTAERYDGIYCYYMVDGGAVARLPGREPAQLNANPDGLSYPVTSGLPNRGRFLLSGHAARDPVTLMLKCRGYRGAMSLDLGKIELSHPTADWDGSTRTAVSPASPGFSLRYCINTGASPCGAPAGTGTYLSGLLLPPFEILFHLPAPAHLSIRNTLDACDEYAGADPGRYAACIFSSIFGVGQNTLYWEWSSAGSLWNEASLSGYRVSAQITDLASGVSSGYFQHDIHPGTRKFALAYLPGDCGKRLTYSVQAVVGDRLSEPSETLSYDTPACPTAVKVHISFDQFSLGPIDDQGDSWFIPPPRDDVLELDVYLHASGGSLTSALTKGSMPTGQPIREGTYNLTTFSFMGFSPLPITPRRSNNFLDVIVTNDRQNVRFDFAANDMDDHWFGAAPPSFDTLCILRQTLPARSLQNWLLFSQTYNLEGSQSSETYCRAVIHVTVLPYP